MPASRTILAHALAVVIGMSLWFVASLTSGKREPWDDTAYWTGAYPIAIVISGAMGYIFPERPWRWALELCLSQFVAMAIRNGEIGNLWPLGLILFAILSVPGLLLGQFTAWLRGKLSTT
jgi:hypothetical protein